MQHERWSGREGGQEQKKYRKLPNLYLIFGNEKCRKVSVSYGADALFEMPERIAVR